MNSLKYFPERLRRRKRKIFPNLSMRASARQIMVTIPTAILRRTAWRGHPFNPPCFLLGEGTTTHECCVGTGRIIRIQDIAFITYVSSEMRPSHYLKHFGRFQALLFYPYTGSIKFAPYGSKEDRGSRSTEVVFPPNDPVPRPSPKSIYRLADKVHSHHTPSADHLW